LVRLFLAGDVLLARPWSGDADPGFQRLVRTMRAADVTIVNLETLLHEYGGWAQPESGGTWVSSPPAIGAELAWAGVDAVAAANNHSFDYGEHGVLENAENVAKSGLVMAGAGAGLAAAESPRIIDHPAGRIGLVSAASCFVAYGRASRARPGHRGRPGLNPLETTRKSWLRVTRSTADLMGRFSRRCGYSGDRFAHDRFRIGRLPFRVADRHGITRGERIVPSDRARNLALVRDAAVRSDCAVFSLHAHLQGRWLRRFAREVVDAGANVVFVHGPHEVRGIELYRDRPIFYGLGDFVFEPEHMEPQPWEAYEAYGLADDATSAELESAITAGGTRGLRAQRKTYEGLAAQVEIENGRAREIRLLPLDLRFGLPERGRPRWADPALGRRIVADAARLSRRFGTRIEWLADEQCGRIAGSEPS